MSEKDGGKAFPTPAGHHIEAGARVEVYEGMTLRDWFAGQALAGGALPQDCYIRADKVLAERDKENKDD